MQWFGSKMKLLFYLDAYVDVYGKMCDFCIHYFSVATIIRVVLMDFIAGCGLWINNFPVQNFVRKIFLSWQQKSVLRIVKCQMNHMINRFPYMQKEYMFVISKHYLFSNMSIKKLFLSNKPSSFFRSPDLKKIYIYFWLKFMKVET